MKSYVWYACYGSNINYDRFLLYILGGKKDFYDVEVSNSGCKDALLPKKSKPYIINHPIYFAKEINRWGGGVAFLNTNEQGISLGRAYLILEDQLRDIQQQEGIWYDTIIDLGVFENYPIKTFTGFHFDFAKPSMSYLNTIKDGLKQIGYKHIDIDLYLKKYE
jgi:hypothetical protein